MMLLLRAMGMVSVWYKQENAELEPLEEEVDYIITTIEELLTILSVNKQKKEIIKWNYLQEKVDLH